MALPTLKWVQITGDISVEPVNGRTPRASNRFLIMGPTGAGKSSFIEALAGESQQLSISKDQLAGYTQTVNAYKVINIARFGHPVHLLDTPGFSDSKISEVEIIGMVRKWLTDNDLQYVNGILYLIPISDIRLPGSRRRTIEMLKQFLEPTGVQKSVTFVTTMWDRLYNEGSRARAESNFAQLREFFKNVFGVSELFITRFMNTRSSALEILDTYCSATDSFSKPIYGTSSNLYRDLHERIKGALQEEQMIESDLAQPEVQNNADLRFILERNQRENSETLAKFIGQLINFGSLPFGFHIAAQHLRKEIAAQVTPEDPERREIFQQWAQEPEILEEPVPEPNPETSLEPLALSSRTLAPKALLRRLINTANRR